MGSSPSMVRSSSNGAPVDQACGLHGGRVLHRVLRRRARVAAERLGEAAVEEVGRVEDAGRDARGFVLEPVSAQSPGDERVVEGPHGADVVADRVAADLAFGQGADAPTREQARPHEVPHDGLGLRLVDDPAPQQVAVVRGERVDLAAVRVERDGEVLAVVDPEVAVESALERRPHPSPGGRRSPGRARSRVPGGRRGSWRRTRSPGARRWLAGSPAAGRRDTRSSPRSPSSTGSRARSSRCGAGRRCSRCLAGRRTRRSS